MANNLSINSPEIKATIKWLREKSGVKEEADKRIAEYRAEIAALRSEVKRLNDLIENREVVYRREYDRVIAFIRMLTTIHGTDLKKAVSLIVYWDKFSWITCDIVERMCLADKRVKAFFDLPSNYGNIKSVLKFVGKKKFADALNVFGFTNANERTRIIQKH